MVVSCINACGFGLSYNIFWLAFCSLLWWMLHYRLHCSCFTLFPSAHTSLFMFHCYFLQSTVHLIHFTYRSPSRSYLSYLVAFILHGHSTMLSVSLFSQSLGISDLRVSLDEFFILDGYSLVEAEFRWFYYSLSLCVARGIQWWGVAWVF